MSRAIDPSELSRYAPGNLGLDWLGRQLARHRADGARKPEDQDKPQPASATTASASHHDSAATIKQMMLEITNSGVDAVDLGGSPGRRRP